MVEVGVKVGVGVAVGGTIICVTKLQDNSAKTSNPKNIRFIFMITLDCSSPSHVPVNPISV